MYLSRVTYKTGIADDPTSLAGLFAGTYSYHQQLWDLFDDTERQFLYRIELAEEQLSHGAEIRGVPIFYVLSSRPPATVSKRFDVVCKPFAPNFTKGQKLGFRARVNPVVTRAGKRHDIVMDEQRHFYANLCDQLGVDNQGSKGSLIKRLLEECSQTRLKEVLQEYLSEADELTVSSGLTNKQLLHKGAQLSISKRLIDWLVNNPSRQGVMSIASYQHEDEWGDCVQRLPAFQWQRYMLNPLPEKGKNAQFRSVDLQGELIVNDPARFNELLKKGIGSAKGFGCGLMLVRNLAY